MTHTLNELKQQAAETAVQFVQSGMIVGLGTGSTAVYAVRAIGQMLQDGRLQDVLGVPTSEATAHEAQQWRVPLTNLDTHPIVDVTIDGADEADPHLDLIKGLGGALLREKIVAAASRQLVIVADHTKRVNQLGTRAPVPVETVPFARRPVHDFLASLGAQVALRPHPDAPHQPYLTDEGNVILDCYFGPLADPSELARAIRSRPGVVEHGLFLGLATHLILASPHGIEQFQRPVSH